MDTRGLTFLKLQQLGRDELQWAQAEALGAIEAVRRARVLRPGWFGSRNARCGRARYGWEIHEDGATGRLELQTSELGASTEAVGLAPANDHQPKRYAGVDPDGKVLELLFNDDVYLRDEDWAIVTVPNDGTWYTLVARVLLENLEPGTLAFTAGSSTVTGTRTFFRRYTATTPNVGLPTILRVDADDSALVAGEYTILTITDDDTMTVSPTPTATDSAVRFRTKARFYSPPGAADPVDAHWCQRVVWELRARVTGFPTDAVVAYDCRRTGGVLTLLDRRWGNEYVEMPWPGASRSTVSRPAMFYSRSSDAAVGLRGNAQNNLGSADVTAIDVAPYSQTRFFTTGSEATRLALYYKDSTIIKVLTESGLGTTFGWLSTASPVDLVTGLGTVNGMAVEQVPADSGFTHLLVYSEGGLIKLARLNGTSVVSSATIWDPTPLNAGNTVEYPSILYTHGGRVLVAAVFKNAAAGNAKSIRTIQSDDYGVTWNDNGDAGITCVSSPSAPRHTEMVQDAYGNIHGMYVEDNAGEDELWLWHGLGLDTAEIDNVRAITNNRGTKVWQTTGSTWAGGNVGQPRAITHEDGTIEVAFAVTTGAAGAQNVVQLALKDNDLIDLFSAVSVVDSGDYAGATHPPVGFEVGVGGSGRLAYVNTDAGAAGDLEYLFMDAVQRGGAAHWPGGL